MREQYYAALLPNSPLQLPQLPVPLLPQLSARKDFKKLLGKMGLQARGTGGVDSASTGGTWDISNADRIGKGEVDLVNVLIEGAAKLVEWETAMNAGNSGVVDYEVGCIIGR